MSEFFAKTYGAGLVYAPNQTLCIQLKIIGFCLVLQSWGMVPRHFFMFETYAHWVCDRSLPYPLKFRKVIIVFPEF